jgi:hypothetical protein
MAGCRAWHGRSGAGLGPTLTMVRRLSAAWCAHPLAVAPPSRSVQRAPAPPRVHPGKVWTSVAYCPGNGAALCERSFGRVTRQTAAFRTGNRTQIPVPDPRVQWWVFPQSQERFKKFRRFARVHGLEKNPVSWIGDEVRHRPVPAEVQSGYPHGQIGWGLRFRAGPGRRAGVVCRRVARFLFCRFGRHSRWEGWPIILLAALKDWRYSATRPSSVTWDASRPIRVSAAAVVAVWIDSQEPVAATIATVTAPLTPAEARM